MTRKSNKEIERYYFEMFRGDYQLPYGTIVYDDKPDVILIGKRKIGIEITNFFREKGSLSESEQAQVVMRAAVVSEAQLIYLAAGGEKIELSFGFDPERPIRNRKDLAKNIAALAKNIENLKTGEIRRENFKEIPELSFVYLNATEYENAKWRVTQVHSATFMSMERLREIIKDKEVKAREYQSCNSYWLLVVVDFTNPAQDQEIQIDGFEKINSDIFEKVIVYKTVFGHVLEVR